MLCQAVSEEGGTIANCLKLCVGNPIIGWYTLCIASETERRRMATLGAILSVVAWLAVVGVVLYVALVLKALSFAVIRRHGAVMIKFLVVWFAGVAAAQRDPGRYPRPGGQWPDLEQCRRGRGVHHRVGGSLRTRVCCALSVVPGAVAGRGLRPGSSRRSSAPAAW